MNQQEILDMIEKNALEAILRDDICARSTMYGLKTYFDFIPEEMVSATMSLLGGGGRANGSCGAYISGMLAIGAKYNPTVEAELADPSQIQMLRKQGFEKLLEYRDAFLKEFGTTLCPDIHKQLFGRSFNLIDDEEDAEFLGIPDHVEKCSVVVKKAARLAAKLLLEDDRAARSLGKEP